MQCERRVEGVPPHLFSFVSHQFLCYLGLSGIGQKRRIRKVKSLVMGPVASEKERRSTSRDTDLKAARLPEGYIWGTPNWCVLHKAIVKKIHNKQMGRGESKNSDISVMRVCGESDDDPNTHHHKYKK